MPTKRAHARFSPSASYRWLNCPGSVVVNDSGAQGKGEPVASFYAIEGSAAHTLLEMCMRLESEPEDLVGAKLGNDKFEVTEEMAAAVGHAIDYTAAVMAKHGGELATEQFVSIGPKYGYTDDDISGHLDLEIDAGHTLWVIDYKHGAGVQVEAKDNTQLLHYAAGRLKSTHKRVILVVIQPRSWKKRGPVDEWNVRPREIIRFMEKRSIPAIQAAEQPDAPRIAGEWCRWCAVAGTCKVRRAFIIALAVDDFDAEEPIEMPNTEDMTPAELGKLLLDADLMEAAIHEWRATALNMLLHGTKVPGWKTGLGRSIREWANAKAAQRTMARLALTEDDYMPRSLVSPAQAEKLLRSKGVIPRKKRGGPKPKNPLEKFVGYTVAKTVLERDENESSDTASE